MKTPIKLCVVLAALLAGSSLHAVDFAEFYSEPKKEDLLTYLVETVSMTEKLAAGDEKVSALEMRNRIEQIYDFYMLRFAPEIEGKVVANLEKAARSTGNASEIKFALEAINKKRGASYKESLDLVARLKELAKTMPNQSPDPTPASVTPAAGQPPRQP